TLPAAAPVNTPSARPIRPIQPPTALQPAIPESRRLVLEYPPRIRLGDSEIIRLTLEMDNQGNLTPTAIVEGNVTKGESIQIPNLYKTHNVIAEARLDLAGIDIRPTETISEPLLPGQSVTFYWSVRPQETGHYLGTVWLHLLFVPKIGGPESRKAISAQRIEIETTSFFGLPASLARTSGTIGSLIGSLLSFPFLEQIVRFLFRRRKHSAS
ncbi:MAG: hypothetical protein ACP5QU_02920, partial [Anaerolineae bacterium]